MIRFIDLRHVAEDIGGDRFAFFDTVTCAFVTDNMDCQTWGTIGEFAQGYGGIELARFVQLTPEWAKHAEPEREVYKLEVKDHGSMRAHAHACNEDDSATCHVPLAPVVLEAMAGRKVAYFYGAQVLAYDETIGAIEGQIVIDFNAEAKDQTW